MLSRLPSRGHASGLNIRTETKPMRKHLKMSTDETGKPPLAFIHSLLVNLVIQVELCRNLHTEPGIASIQEMFW